MAEQSELNEAQARLLVAQYLQAQDWRLVNPAEFAETIWQAAAGGWATKQAIETQIWRQYAAILHETCRHPDGAAYQRAWFELDNTLRRRQHSLPGHPQEREEAVQETLTTLQIKLAKEPLTAPRAFLVYALNALRRTAIDRNRRETAVTRGGDQVIESWEEQLAANPNQPAAPIQPAATAGQEKRSVEQTVSNREVHAQLKAFFGRHLKSDQQIVVAELLFLDDLPPREIAALLGKKPHEIRMIKSRIVQTLRGLPPDAQQTLLALLDQADREESDES